MGEQGEAGEDRRKWKETEEGSGGRRRGYIQEGDKGKQEKGEHWEAGKKGGTEVKA